MTRMDTDEGFPGPFGGRTSEEYRRLLEEKLEPVTLRSTLAFAGLFQLTHEMLKHAIVDKVRGFYVKGFDESGKLYDEDGYRKVLSLDTSPGKPNKFRASTTWLVEYEAITNKQSERLDEIYHHRHELTHELADFLINIDRNPDLELFTDALTILRDIHRFWTQIEIDIGSFEHLGEIEVDDAVPLSLMILQRCIDAYPEGLESPQTRD